MRIFATNVTVKCVQRLREVIVQVEISRDRLFLEREITHAVSVSQLKFSNPVVVQAQVSNSQNMLRVDRSISAMYYSVHLINLNVSQLYCETGTSQCTLISLMCENRSMNAHRIYATAYWPKKHAGRTRCSDSSSPQTGPKRRARSATWWSASTMPSMQVG